MLRSSARSLSILFFSMIILLCCGANVFAADTLPDAVSGGSGESGAASVVELPEVLDYPYKTALFEYFSGKYPDFDRLLSEESFPSLMETGDDNLTLISELSPEFVVYLGNLYQLFFTRSAVQSDTPVKSSTPSLISLLKGDLRSLDPPAPEQDDGSAEALPGSVWFLDKLYKHSFYSDLMRISKKELLRSDETGATAYFRGITWLALNNPVDATSELKLVERSSPLYPYARVAFAQALFNKGDLSGAETELKALLIGAQLEVELREKVRLLLGQVYFEEDLFNEALLEFMNIPRTSPYYRKAVIGTSWALIKNGTFASAVDMLKELKTEPPYNKLEWEAKVMLGYGYMQLDQYDKALMLFEELLAEVTRARTRLGKMRKDPSAPARYLNFLLKDQQRMPENTQAYSSSKAYSNSKAYSSSKPYPNSKASLSSTVYSESEEMYFTLLRQGGLSQVLLQEYGVVLRLREAILSRQSEIAERRIYFENMTKGMQNLFSLVDLESRLIKTILVSIDRGVDPEKDPRESINMLNRDFFADVEKGLYVLWIKIKKREINDNEKEVVRLLLYDVGESLDCVSTSLICTIVDMADNAELSSSKLLELADIMDILEAIAKDIENVRSGGLIEYEKSIEGLRQTVIAKRKAAEAGIEQLDVMDIRLKRFLDEEDIKMRRRMLAIVKERIKVRGKNFNDELTELRAHIMTGLISSQKAVEEGMEGER